MDENQRETLVFVESGDYERVIAELSRFGSVTQALPPRLVLVSMSTVPGAEIPSVPGTAWYGDDVPPEVFELLSPSERIFVDAWRSRRFAKERPGDGESWDAPGRTPPDFPAR